MKSGRLFIVTVLVCLVTAPRSDPAQRASGIDPDALIQQILNVQAKQRAAINDVILDAEYIEGDKENDGTLEEKKRFIKKIYVRYLPDTTWYHEDYLEYYKEGKLQEEKELAKQAREQAEKKQKRKTRNMAYPMLTPFEPHNQDQYVIAYQGVTEERIEGFVCHQFRVDAREKDPDRINGDYWFDAESFQLVRVDFSPAKLRKNIMFKLNRLSMTMTYAPTPDGYWLPRRFEIEGKGKAAFFFGTKFAATEYYSNPQINAGIQAEVFEVKDDRH
jgi:hypothetical protein